MNIQLVVQNQTISGLENIYPILTTIFLTIRYKYFAKFEINCNLSISKNNCVSYCYVCILHKYASQEIDLRNIVRITLKDDDS